MFSFFLNMKAPIMYVVHFKAVLLKKADTFFNKLQKM